MAGVTMGATGVIKGQFYHFDLAEQGIKGPQGAGRPAKRPACQHCPDDEKNENGQLEQKKPPQVSLEGGLEHQHGNPCLQCAGWAEILAEPGGSGAEFINGKQG